MKKDNKPIEPPQWILDRSSTIAIVEKKAKTVKPKPKKKAKKEE